MAEKQTTTTAATDNPACRCPGARPPEISVPVEVLIGYDCESLWHAFHAADEHHSAVMTDGRGPEERYACRIMDLTRSLMVSARASDVGDIAAKVRLIRRELQSLCHDNEDFAHAHMLVESVLLDCEVLPARERGERMRAEMREAADA